MYPTSLRQGTTIETKGGTVDTPGSPACPVRVTVKPATLIGEHSALPGDTPLARACFDNSAVLYREMHVILRNAISFVKWIA
jgi:hypothetical protein